MLAEGKITADEADRLLSAIDQDPPPDPAAPGRKAPSPKYIRVEVDAERANSGPTKVNIRVPMTLLRAGVRLSAFMPPAAREEVNAAMAKQGVNFDINQLKPENLEDLIDQLAELTVNVNNDRANVRIYFE
jgi:hypothetical protein